MTGHSILKHFVRLGALGFFLVFGISAEGTDGFLSNFSLPPKNFVRNGDFAGGLSKENWHFFKADVSGGIFKGISNEKPDGGSCFKVSGSFNDTVCLQQLFMPNDTALEVGKTYTMSALFKAENIQGVDPDKIMFFLNYGWHSDSIPFGPSARTTNGWERRSVTFVAPATKYPADSYKYALFLWWPKGASGTLWMTNVQIEEGTKATDFTSVYNYTLKGLADDLRATYEAAVRMKKNLEENFHDSALAGNLAEKLSGIISEIETSGNDILAAGATGGTKIREMQERLARFHSDIARIICLVWYKNPYLPCDEKSFPDSIGDPEPKKFICYVNETRNFGIVFTNMAEKSISYRIAPQRFVRLEDGIETDGKAFFAVYQAPLIRGALYKTRSFTDPLPRANEMNGICVPGGESTEVVLSINTADIVPGTYKGSILLDALNGNPALSKTIAVEMEVLPVSLPDKVPVDVGPFGSNVLREEEAKRLGHNFITVFSYGPQIYLDDKGDLTRSSDYTDVEREIGDARKVVPDCKFSLPFGNGIRFLSEVETLYGYKWPEERVKKAWKNWVKDIAAHMQSLGVDLNAWYLPVVDEPQASQIELVTELTRLAKEAVPGLRVMTWGGAFPGLDLSVPGSSHLQRPGYLDELRKTVSSVELYDCQEYCEIINPLIYRRLMPWKVWKYNLAGWQYWYRDDREPNWSCVKTFSCLYPLTEREFGRLLTPDVGYVISRHWLAMEAGYQDYKALFLLNKVVAEARSKGIGNDVLAPAESFLKTAPDKALSLINPAKFPFEMAAGVDPDTLDRLREEMAVLTAGLHQTNKFELRTAPALDEKGNLSFTANRPCTFRAEYIVDGKLPRHEVAVEKEATSQNIQLDKFNGQVINKCRLDIFSEDGQVLTSSPLIEGRLSVDSTIDYYEYSCLVDGIRYPGAQFWPGKTWISNPGRKEHWVALSWQKERAINKVMLSWMGFAGLPESYKVQYENAGTWKDIGGWRRSINALDVIEFSPLQATGIRIVQNIDGGNIRFKNMMGMSEIEVYGP